MHKKLSQSLKTVKELKKQVELAKENLNSEAGAVENALQRSFGNVTSQVRRRTKASDNLIAAAAHWTDGDAKRLVLALAHRYGTNVKYRKQDFKKPTACRVDSPRNSVCNSSRLSELDWQRGWWTDDSFGMHYLHVYHKDGETIHRVYCKHCQQPRIEQRQGKLYWLFCK
jgi:hypothetical protein